MVRPAETAVPAQAPVPVRAAASAQAAPSTRAAAGSVPATIPAVVVRAAVDHADRPALAEGNRLVTFAELEGLVRRAAGAFVDAGVGPGDRVAVWAPNSVDWAVASLGVLFAGGAVVPVNARYTGREAADLVARAACRLVVAGSAGSRDLVAESAAFPGHPVVVSLDGTGSLPSGLTGGSTGTPVREVAVPAPPSSGGVTAWADFAGSAGSSAAAEVDRRLAALTPGDVSHVQYTSGTTGRPKGAMLCHGAMVGTTTAWAGIVGLVAGDRYPVVAPFSHIGGHKTGLLACLVAGALAIPLPALDLDRFEQVAVDHQVTVVQGPPTLFHALVERVRAGSSSLGSLRVGVTGAAVVPPSLVEAMHQVLGLDVVVTAYGLTESTGVCTMTRPGDPVGVVAGTSGRPIPGVEVRVVGEDGRPVPAGERGEVEVAGAGVTRGYLDDPEATAAAVRDGWLATGDVGWLGEDGNLRIVDRLKDMVVVGGFNVYPAEVERVLLEHPAVAQAAVIGLADDRMGEVPAAFVVATTGQVIDGSLVPALVAHAGERLAGFKVPRTIWLVDALPVNAVGKVDKTALRAGVASI